MPETIGLHHYLVVAALMFSLGLAVVLTRRLPPGLTPVARTQVAFAVWQGRKQEAGPRKMRTGWVPLALEVRS